LEEEAASASVVGEDGFAFGRRAVRRRGMRELDADAGN